MRVLIAASDVAAAEAVRRALRYAPTCRVIGWIDSHDGSVRAIVDAKPDVLVIDASAADAEMLTVVRRYRAVLPNAKLLLLADELDPVWLNGAVEAGIDGAIAKSASPAGVGMLVREIAAGHVFHFAASSRSADTPRPRREGLLTNRELEILSHVAAGLSNGRIARELWVTEQTVKFHLSNVYRKLGLSNRTEAAHYAYVNGIDGASMRTPDRVAA